MRRRPTVLIAVLVAAAAAPALAHASTVTGTVYADRDKDGLFSAGDEVLAGVTVAWETSVFATTGTDGRFSLTAPRDGIIWVSTPDGFTPGPVWRQVRGSVSTNVELGLTPATATGPVSFVQGSDPHLGTTNAEETRAALDLAVDILPPPHFLVITGDLTSNTLQKEVDLVDQAMAGIDLPFVPVPGNHDWHDGGPAYRHRWGPPMYSFDSGGVHFIVLNFNAPAEEQTDFVAADTARLQPGTTIIVFTHAPPEDALAAQLDQLGVNYLFTGHVHSNRVIARALGLREYNTEAMAMGGNDYTPAGFRVVALTASGMVIEHHNTVDQRVAVMTWPRPGECLPRGPVALLAAVEMGAGHPDVTVSIDDRPPLPLTFAGGWTYRAEVADLATGQHSLTLRARAGGPSHTTMSTTQQFCVIGRSDAPGASGDWPQLGGGPGHLGAVPDRLDPPLRTVWADSVGGYIFGGSPVVADGRLFVPVVDYAAGDAGGVVAFDLRTGARLWRATSGAAVHGSPVVADGRVMFVSSDGVVHAHDAATGAQLWITDAGAGLDRSIAWSCGSPLYANDLLYVNVQHRMVALDPATGHPSWTVDGGGTEVGFTRAAPTAAGDVVIAPVGRGPLGVIAWRGRDGEELWRQGRPMSLAVSSSPIVDGERLFLINVESRLFVADAASGAPEWSVRLYGKDVDWGNGPIATPALAHGVLVLPTPRRFLYALDAEDGHTLWTLEATPSVLRPLPYKAHTLGFLGAPAIAGDLVWVPGADGWLRALQLEDGRLRWQTYLGTPLMSGVVVAGDYLVVGSYDGTIRVMTPGAPAALVADDGAGCGQPPVGTASASFGVGGWGAAALAILLFGRRRRAWRRNSESPPA